MKVKRISLPVLFLLLFASVAYPQTGTKDTTVNNLVHASGYKTSEWNVIPEYIKAGKGKQTLILIPGMGFDASVFTDFIEVNKNNFTMYAITIPGYGNTKAPPMPDTSVSYGEQSWNNSAIEGISKLIEKEKLIKPVIVGHFVQGVQLAVRLAVKYPDKVGGLILMGGPAKFIGLMNGKVLDYTVDKMIIATDKYSGPIWFKKMKKSYFDENNFLPEIYSLDKTKAALLWKQPSTVSLPVAIRYSCEYFAIDVRAEFDKIKCPVLVLRAMFNKQVLESTTNSYLPPQFIDSWNDASTRNPLIKVKDIPDAATFVWKDKPIEVYNEIKTFITAFN